VNANREPYLLLRDFKVYFEKRRGLLAALRRSRPDYIRAVDGIDVTIGKGEIYCLVGESGCGKTTTGMGILRLVEPTGGDVFVDLPPQIREQYEQARAQEDRPTLASLRRRYSLTFERKFEPTRRNYAILVSAFVLGSLLGVVVPALAMAFAPTPFDNLAIDLVWAVLGGLLVGFSITVVVPQGPRYLRDAVVVVSILALNLAVLVAMVANAAYVTRVSTDPLTALEAGFGNAGGTLLFLEIIVGSALAWEASDWTSKFLQREPDVEASIARMRGLRRSLQIIFQDPYESLNPRHTVYDIVAEPLAVNKITRGRAETEARVIQALEEAGLRPAKDFLFRFPHELSGGQRQRLSIAAALVLDPQFLVADEPVSMLDVSIRTEILELLLDLRRRRGLTYLFITHDLSLAWVLADRVAVMYLGKIVEEGPTREIVKNPRHPYTKALVSVIPSPDPDRRRERTILKGERPDPANVPAGCRFHPRCPAAFELCGWTSDELLIDLKKLAASSPPSTPLEGATAVSPLVLRIPATGPDLEGWLRSQVAAHSEEYRVLAAIQQVSTGPEGLTVTLHPFAEPDFREVAPAVRAACHLYDAEGVAARVSAALA
jgi:oligopeptide/dipeptide ABC transporter ATP-binding protein